MKILVTESQFEVLKEYFNPIQYLRYLINRVNYDDIDFESFQWMDAFQKFVNLIFKYTKAEMNLKGLKGFKISHIDKKPSLSIDPQTKSQRVLWKINLRPSIEKNMPFSEYPQMKEDYSKFISLFQDTARYMGLNEIPAVESEGIPNAKIVFEFYNINPNDFDRKAESKEMKETELKERCWKGYTQKGMKTMFGKRYPNCVKKKK